MANLEHVLPALREGKAIYRESEDDLHWRIGNNGQAGVLVFYTPTGQKHQHPGSFQAVDILADDWFVAP